MKENSIRRAVREGRAALGTGLKEFASRGVPWIIEQAGFDYCAIDHEHGAFDMETIANLASWFQATNVTAIVRIHKSFAHLIPGILDQGIMGIQVSEVETAQEARAIVRLAVGRRSPRCFRPQRWSVRCASSIRTARRYIGGLTPSSSA
jgi:2-keto-3-deoxy-L-rhamnonate aldolase RhmA